MFDISRSYWNNRELEDEKEIFRLYMRENTELVLHGSHLEAFVHSKELLEKNQIHLNHVLSLACGSCWLEALLIKWRKFNSLTGVDFSDIRIREMAEETIRQSGIIDFDLKVSDVYEFSSTKKFDLIIMCQSFHHMDSPVYLLKNIRKMLARNGHILIVGEHRYNFSIGMLRLAKHFIKWGINYRGHRKSHYLIPGYSDLFGPSLEFGDNHYFLNHYEVMFKRGGFRIIDKIDRKGEKTKSFLLGADTQY